MISHHFLGTLNHTIESQLNPIQLRNSTLLSETMERETLMRIIETMIKNGDKKIIIFSLTIVDLFLSNMMTDKKYPSRGILVERSTRVTNHTWHDYQLNEHTMAKPN